ncbi:hypothetical protein OAT18_03945 [Tenacibaculum sp.]|nr:hypothetical protein [Tenacibaculum sp.]
MYAQVEKFKENKSRAVANSAVQKKKKSSRKQGFGFVDNRPESNLLTLVAQNKVMDSESTKLQDNRVGTVSTTQLKIIQMVKYVRMNGGILKKVGNDYNLVEGESWVGKSSFKRYMKKQKKKAEQEPSSGSLSDNQPEQVIAEEVEPTWNESFEASGDGSHALQEIRNMANEVPEGQWWDIQVGFYEPQNEMMEGAHENILDMQNIAANPVPGKGRLKLRIRVRRDATRPTSPTRYNRTHVRNIMAGDDEGNSDTRFEPNNTLTTGVFAAQTPKLKKGGQLHFGASGRPYFKPGDHRDHFNDRVKVDDIARGRGLRRIRSVEYKDNTSVKKNGGERSVGVNGTYTRVYQRRNKYIFPLSR